MYYIGNVPYSSITGKPGPDLPLYNFSDDWQAHLNDAGLGGAWNGPSWVVDGINAIRKALGVPLLEANQGTGSAAAGLSRSNVQQYEADKANGTNYSGMNAKTDNSDGGGSLVSVIVLSLFVLIIVNIFRK